jgi:multidrug resistance efflux pump
MTPEQLSRLAVTETHVAILKEDVSEIKDDVKAIRRTLDEARGGWKTLVMIAGVAGTVGAFIGKYLPFLPMK